MTLDELINYCEYRIGALENLDLDNRSDFYNGYANGQKNALDVVLVNLRQIKEESSENQD